MYKLDICKNRQQIKIMNMSITQKDFFVSVCKPFLLSPAVYHKEPLSVTIDLHFYNFIQVELYGKYFYISGFFTQHNYFRFIHFVAWIDVFFALLSITLYGCMATCLPINLLMDRIVSSFCLIIHKGCKHMCVKIFVKT